MDLESTKTWIGSIILLIILASIGAIIIVELIPSMKSSGTQEADNITAEGSYINLIHTGDYDFPAEISGLLVGNQSDGAVFNSGNYTLDSTLGRINFTVGGDSGHEASGTVFMLNYSYSVGNTQTSILTNGTSALKNVTKQIPTLGIIVGVLLIIGAVVAMTVYFGRKTGYA